MRVEGRETKKDISSANMKQTIYDMLESFAVGTEQTKLAVPKKPDPNELIPLRQLKCDSLSQMVKKKKNKKRVRLLIIPGHCHCLIQII